MVRESINDDKWISELSIFVTLLAVTGVVFPVVHPLFAHLTRIPIVCEAAPVDPAGLGFSTRLPSVAPGFP